MVPIPFGGGGVVSISVVKDGEELESYVIGVAGVWILIMSLLLDI